MFPIFGVFFAGLGSGLVYRYRKAQVSDDTTRKIFLVIGLLAVLQQIIQISYTASTKRYYEMQYTDLCMMNVLVMIVSSLTYNKTIIRLSTPWVFLGWVLTFFVGNPELLPNTDHILNSLFAHGLLCAFWFSALLLVRNYTKRDLRNSYIFIICFIAYVVVMLYSLYALTFDWRFFANSTGLFEESHIKGQNYEVLGDVPLPYPIPTILFYIVACFCTFLIWYFTIKFHSYLDKFNVNLSNTTVIIKAKKFQKEQMKDSNIK